MAFIYFPKEGDKTVNSCSYPITEHGLAFTNPIQKLDVLVNAGFIKKLEIKDLPMGCSPMISDKTFPEWVELLKNPSTFVAPVIAPKAVEIVTPVIVEAPNVIVSEPSVEIKDEPSIDAPKADSNEEKKSDESVVDLEVKDEVTEVENKEETKSEPETKEESKEEENKEEIKDSSPSEDKRKGPKRTIVKSK